MIDLPVKLMLIVIIVSLSVPILAGAMERGEVNGAVSAMNSETDRLFNSAAAVHYSGIGSSRTVHMNIPDGCELVIPGGNGSEGYSVKMFFKGSDVGTRYMDRPPVIFISDGITISGSCVLLITSDIQNGSAAVRVTIV
jgi:hypothetical protein